ncbi:PREDICTED: probable mediator of RNA polymerase II transcription subunit 26a [Camelina sativa]|uniref:Probable mediator of RNA polymerase II transcription subunit 26a n=1 Tax=Camelina sativa TaxID=90675 RepID=A0ABM0XW53_CAMSA|nr:PREDICTED: probable mediator of RNA polymerase II transcription subunit 26a [Camelina sativa]
MMKRSESLDNWREYFRRGDSDIFGIIDHAIMVAASDYPNEFKSRRDSIAELLFSYRLSRRHHHHLDVSIHGDQEEEFEHCPVTTVETVGVEDVRKLNKKNQIYEEEEEEDDDDTVIVDEVIRIKDILFNKEDEPNSVLLECLRKLESISMNVDMLKDTEIGKAVNGLRRHSSDKISKLAKTLFAEWKKLVDQWMNIPKEIAGAEGTPESVNLSVIDEEETFPSPPHDLDIYAPEPNGFELSQILDCLDCDGNPRHSVESEPERKLQSSSRRRPGGTNEASVVGRSNKDQQMRREEADVRPIKHSAIDFGEPRKQPKQNREQMVQRKPLAVAEQKRKLAGQQQRDKLKALDPDTKFEFAKRRLQESYQHHENAKRQRTIQVLETIPKQSKVHKPQLKRPARR